MRTIIIRSALALALASPGTGIGAQVVPLDDAVFELFRNDQPLGEEHVTLHRRGLGQDARIIGQAEIRLLDGSEARPRLEATTSFRILTYESVFTGAEEGEVAISRVGRRLVARMTSAAGEAQREFRASDGTVILEGGAVLPHYLLRPWFGEADAELTILDPRTGDQSRMTLKPVGNENLTIGRRSHPTRRFRLEGDGPVREIWIDADDRILRIDLPSLGLRAERRR